MDLGGGRAWKQRVKGDIVVSFQWLELWKLGDETAPHEPEPCLVLFSAHRRMDAGAYVIPQRNAFMFATNKGQPTQHLCLAAAKAAATLGFSLTDRSAATRIVDIVLDELAELIYMPIEQPDALTTQRPVSGIEASVKVGGQVIHEEVV
ncbi:hypothetical protein CCO03_17015 [Comamonas serinivorans]|uniref:Uncharacterized protein n=1 Tax=Comamonas serinivorans TaxID=1082851 RepID=A0A1Y0ER61_9BURK|nr:hypothetical protein CCO03_17015 [Comamonas serinivorans]